MKTTCLKSCWVVMATLVSMFPPIAFADTPPAWEPFAIVSANGLFRASIEAADASRGTYPWQRKFRVAVSRIGDGKEAMPVWSAAYQYTGYPHGAKLSDDGEYFVQLGYWYRHDDALVQIQNRQRNLSVNGRALGMRPESLVRTASHQLWLTKDGDFQFEYAGQAATGILINSVQGEKRVELQTSRLIAHPSVSPHPAESLPHSAPHFQ